MSSPNPSLYTYTDTDGELVTLYAANDFCEHPFIETEGDADGAALPPLEAYKLALALIEASNTETIRAGTSTLQDAIDQLELSVSLSHRQKVLDRFGVSIPASDLSAGFTNMIEHIIKLEGTK